jgi:hypothetical protein
MLRTGLLFLAVVACTAGPVLAKDRRYQMRSSFDPSEIIWAKAKGNAAIRGSALLRTRGGDVKSCAGTTINIIPQSTYASERMTHYYGSLEGGLSTQKESITTIDPVYEKTIIETVCDAQGNFEISGLAAGSYFVTAQISWEVPFSRYTTRREGGAMMRRIVLTEGETARVILSNN